VTVEERAAAAADRRRRERELDAAFASTFASPAGEKVLAWLGSITFGRVMGPEASDGALRHLEGQRYVVQIIMERVNRGRKRSRTA